MKKAFQALMGKKTKVEKPIEEEKPFVPNKRLNDDKMTDQEKMDQGFNGSTYSINGRDVDF
tara:strand:+ start:383 stop:565 length:183 start_codon:yes stop_codon:yes gene_type:complete